MHTNKKTKWEVQLWKRVIAAKGQNPVTEWQCLIKLFGCWCLVWGQIGLKWPPHNWVKLSHCNGFTRLSQDALLHSGPTVASPHDQGTVSWCQLATWGSMVCRVWVQSCTHIRSDLLLAFCTFCSSIESWSLMKNSFRNSLLTNCYELPVTIDGECRTIFRVSLNQLICTE